MASQASLALQALAETGLKLMEEGKLEKAREVFQQLLSCLPTGRRRARLSHRRGSQLVINRLEEIAPLNLSEDLNLKARLALANCCLEVGLIEESIHHLERGVELSPDQAEVYCELGLAYERSGREQLALSAWRRALRLNPELPKAYYGLAQHYMKRSQLQAAQRTLNKALRLNPEQQKYYLELASCYSQQGRLDRASYWLQQAAEKFPNNFSIREMLAETYLRLGDYPNLLAQARIFSRLNPRNPYAFELLAMARLHCGDVSGAVESLRRILYLDPLDAVSRLKLALLLQQQGRLGQAMEEYQTIVSLAPPVELSQAALDSIESLDQCQMQQILLRVAEDRGFRLRLRQDVTNTLSEYGYQLSEATLELIQQLEWDQASLADEETIVYH
jgi:tetratricopeptide (TPR) repeat protein